MRKSIDHSRSILEEAKVQNEKAVESLTTGITETSKQVEGLLSGVKSDIGRSLESFTEDIKSRNQEQSIAIKKMATDFSSSTKENNAVIRNVLEQQSEEMRKSIDHSRSILEEAKVQNEKAVESLKTGVNGTLMQVDELLLYIQSNISNVTTSFTKEVQEQSTTFKKIMNDSSSQNISMLEELKRQNKEAIVSLQSNAAEHSKQVDKLLSDVKDNINNTIVSFASNMSSKMQEQSSEINKSIHSTLTITNGIIQDSFQAFDKQMQVAIERKSDTFDKQMQASIERGIEAMGSHLASLSKQFVNDYSPLTDKLRHIIEMTKDLKV